MMNDKLGKSVTRNNDETSSSSSVTGTQSKKSLLDLANETLVNILRFLDSPSHHSNVSLVCKRLNESAEDSSLLKTMELEPEERFANFRKLFNRYRDVQNVTINCAEIEDTRLNILSQLTSLESLVLHECFISEIRLRRQQLPFFATSPSLTSLTLVSVQHCKKLLNRIDPQHLRHLNITFNHIDDKDDLTKFIDKCRRLEDLHIDNRYSYKNRLHLYDSTHINYIFNTLFDTLVSVNIKNEFFIFDSAFSDLRLCPKLRKLSILNCSHFSSESTLYHLTNFNQLTHLKLHNLRDYRNKGIKNMLWASNICNLTTLEIARCNSLKDSNLRRIAILCKNLLNLTLINCSSLTDLGLSLFARNCETLIFLSLAELERVTGSFLLEVKDENLMKGLKTLALDDIFIHWEYVDSLKNSRNELIVRKNIKKNKSASNN